MCLVSTHSSRWPPSGCSNLEFALCIDFEDDGEEESEGSWQQELQRRYAQEATFMAELRARQHPTSPPEVSATNPYMVQANHQVGATHASSHFF